MQFAASGFPRERSIITSVSIRETIDGLSLTARIVLELVHVVDAIADIGAVSPDAVEGQIFYGRPFRCRRSLRRNKYLDDGTFLDRHVFQRPEDAILVFGRDGHRSRLILASSVLMGGVTDQYFGTLGST
jgi:hypothetical protein